MNFARMKRTLKELHDIAWVEYEPLRKTRLMYLDSNLYYHPNKSLIERGDDFNFFKVIHKAKHFEALSVDLYKAVHKRNYYRLLCDDLAPIAWHPDRVIDWCFTEDEKKKCNILLEIICRLDVIFFLYRNMGFQCQLVISDLKNQLKQRVLYIENRLRMIHKKRYYKSLCNDLLPAAWHPDRVVDWCFDEEEKRDLRILWGSQEEEEESVSTPLTIVRHVVDLLCFAGKEEEELWGYLKTTLIHSMANL